MNDSVAITLTGEAARKYAEFLLVENGLSREQAATVLGIGSAVETEPGVLVTQQQAAEILQVSTRSIRLLSASGVLPLAARQGKSPRYRRADLEDYLAGLMHARGRDVIANHRTA